MFDTLYFKLEYQYHQLPFSFPCFFTSTVPHKWENSQINKWKYCSTFAKIATLALIWTRFQINSWVLAVNMPWIWISKLNWFHHVLHKTSSLNTHQIANIKYANWLFFHLVFFFSQTSLQTIFQKVVSGSTFILIVVVFVEMALL